MRTKFAENWKTRYVKDLRKIDFYVKIALEKLELSQRYELPVDVILEDLINQIREVIENEIICH